VQSSAWPQNAHCDTHHGAQLPSYTTLHPIMPFPRVAKLLLFIPFILGAFAELAPADLAAEDVSSSAASSMAGGSSSSSVSSVALSSSSAATLPSATSSSTQAPTETGRITLPISLYSFMPFSTPTQSAISGVFPSTNPKNAPPVQEGLNVVPDFAPAWAAAYKKPKQRFVSHSLFEISICVIP